VSWPPNEPTRDEVIAATEPGRLHVRAAEGCLTEAELRAALGYGSPHPVRPYPLWRAALAMRAFQGASRAGADR